MNINFSRRQLILMGGAAVASTFGPSKDERAVAEAAQVSALDRSVVAISGSDPEFGVAVDTLYPGLASDPSFKTLAPLALLVSHKQGRPVRAFSVSWRITTPAGTSETPLYFYVSLGSPATGHRATASAFRSARRNILQVGQSRLVTPFFSWTPDYYAENSRPNWDIALKPPYPGTFLVSQMQTATQVTVSLDAVIFSDWKMMGPDKFHLVSKIRTRRNAEHDEGLVVYKLIKNGAPDSEILQTLQAHGSAPKSSKKSLKGRWYDQSRRFHAQILLKAFQSTDRPVFEKALTRLKKQRKTLITKVDA